MSGILESIRLLWRADKLHFFIIGCFVLVYSWMYRIALRTFMDGAAFRWVNLLHTQLMGEERRAFIAGNGVDGHFIVILAFAMFSAALLFLLIRRPDGFTKSLLMGWIVIFLIHQITVALGLGSDYVIRGDTMGLVLPFYILGPAQHVLMLVLALLWIARGSSNQLHFPPLPPERRRWLVWIVAGYLPMFILFRAGEQHGLTDQIGIVMLYAQTFLLILGLFHFRSSGIGDHRA